MSKMERIFPYVFVLGLFSWSFLRDSNSIMENPSNYSVYKTKAFK